MFITRLLPDRRARCAGIALLALSTLMAVTPASAQDAPGRRERTPDAVPVTVAEDVITSTTVTTGPADTAADTTATTVASPSVGTATTVAPPTTLPDPSLAQLEALLPRMRPVTDSAEMDTLAARYGSLSSALIGYYAASTGQPLDGFVASHAPQLAAALGRSSMSGLAVGSTDELSMSLAEVGAAVDPRATSSMAAYAADLGSKANSIEANVVGASANWASQMEARMGALAMPEVGAAKLGAPDMPTGLDVPGLPAGALMFGLLTDRSLTAMITDHGDVFGQVQSSGLGTPEAAAAWRSSMVNALAGSQKDFAAALPSPCHATMLTAMASGDATAARAAGGGNCGGCLATGLYLNGQMSRLFDPKVSTTRPDPTDSLLPPAEFNQLQPWQRNLISQQNPELNSGLASSLGSSTTTGCGGARAVQAGASTALPGVFASLGR